MVKTDMHQPYLVHLNYQASLHSRWTPEKVRAVQARGIKVVITYHDTGVPNSDQCQALHAVADRFIVHEPADDLPGAIYWRQGVPVHNNSVGDAPFKGYPTIGTVGFDFPWKNYDLLCEIAGELGWGVNLYTPKPLLKERHQSLLERSRGRLNVFVGETTGDIVAGLSECDATAFLYVTHNTGTSGAIRLGIAAKKPLIAFSVQANRQVRDLCDEGAIHWCDTVEDVRYRLKTLTLSRFDPGIVALAEQDSWTHLGAKYAALYREVVGG
jgi:hypothetical protein